MNSWWNRIPEIWKAIAGLIAAIALVIGTYRGAESYFTKRCDFDEHRKKHNIDIAEISSSFTKTQIRQELRWNSKEQDEVKRKLNANPNSEADKERLMQLQREREEMERDLAETISKQQMQERRN